MNARAKAELPPAGRNAVRAERNRASILKAAAALLAEEGGNGFTISALIARTGGARTTIYRLWRSRDDLLAETLPMLERPANMPDDSRTRILKAATLLLVGRGTSGFSIDALVSRTGIAKTTVYRYWPSRAELLSATIEHMGGATRIPNTGSLRNDLLEFFMRPLRDLQDEAGTHHFPSLPSIIQAAKNDPETLAIGQRMHEVTLSALSPMLQRAQARGEVHPDRDIEVMTHMLYGAAFVYGGMGHHLTEDFVTKMIDIFLGGVSVHPAQAQRARSSKPAAATRMAKKAAPSRVTASRTARRTPRK